MDTSAILPQISGKLNLDSDNPKISSFHKTISHRIRKLSFIVGYGLVTPLISRTCSTLSATRKGFPSMHFQDIKDEVIYFLNPFFSHLLCIFSPIICKTVVYTDSKDNVQCSIHCHWLKLAICYMHCFVRAANVSSCLYSIHMSCEI